MHLCFSRNWQRDYVHTYNFKEAKFDYILATVDIRNIPSIIVNLRNNFKLAYASYDVDDKNYELGFIFPELDRPNFQQKYPELYNVYITQNNEKTETLLPLINDLLLPEKRAKAIQELKHFASSY